MWYIYIMQYYSAIKRNEMGSFVETWMNLENIILSEVVRQRKTNMRSLTYVWNLKKYKIIHIYYVLYI